MSDELYLQVANDLAADNETLIRNLRESQEEVQRLRKGIQKVRNHFHWGNDDQAHLLIRQLMDEE